MYMVILIIKAWTAIDRISVIWKSDLTDRIKCSFFQAAVVSILLYRCITWMLTKRIEKKFDGNYIRMLRVILNKSWRQHHTKQQLYGHLPLITKTIEVRQTRYVRHCWRSKDKLISDVLLWTPSHGWANARRPARTYSSSVPIQDVALKTCHKQWTIERGGQERVRDIRADGPTWWWYIYKIKYFLIFFGWYNKVFFTQLLQFGMLSH